MAIRVRDMIAAGLVSVGLIGAAVTAELPGQSYQSKDEKRVAKVGEQAPDFTLKGVDGKEHKLSEYTKDGKIVVLEWFNPRCPWVKLHHSDNKTMAETYAKYKDKDVVWLAINSGSPNSGTSGVELNAKAKKDWNIQYPLLVDTTSEVGRLYGAKTTPHMYVIDKDGILAYKGAIDADRYKPGSENHVANALEQLIAGESVVVKETRSYGCSVKYPRG